VAEAHWITAQSDRNPAVSPEGTRLVFSSDRSGRQALYLRNLADGATSLLVGGDDMPGYPTWSPDGKWIVFTARVSGEADLFVIGADGRDRRALVTHPARDGHPRWSPDGKRVYFNSERPAAEPRTDAVTSPEGEDRVDIYSVAADGSAAASVPILPSQPTGSTCCFAVCSGTPARQVQSPSVTRRSSLPISMAATSGASRPARLMTSIRSGRPMAAGSISVPTAKERQRNCICGALPPPGVRRSV
jgi:dipeptidyl aminopeptidase/acylaminoacyl peptidase